MPPCAVPQPSASSGVFTGLTLEVSKRPGPIAMRACEDLQVDVSVRKATRAADRSNRQMQGLSATETSASCEGSSRLSPNET